MVNDDNDILEGDININVLNSHDRSYNRLCNILSQHN